jgi:hypothetical protein
METRNSLVWELEALGNCVPQSVDLCGKQCRYTHRWRLPYYNTPPLYPLGKIKITKMLVGMWILWIGASPILHNKPHAPHASPAFILRIENATNVSGHAAKPYTGTVETHEASYIRAMFLWELKRRVQLIHLGVWNVSLFICVWEECHTSLSLDFLAHYSKWKDRGIY